MTRIKIPNDTEHAEIQVATHPTALCLDDGCPWKHVGPISAAQAKAYEHVVDSGHAVRLYQAVIDFLPVAMSRKEADA